MEKKKKKNEHAFLGCSLFLCWSFSLFETADAFYYYYYYYYNADADADADDGIGRILGRVTWRLR